MAVRMLLVLLTLTGLVPVGECTCASAHHHETDVDSVAISPFVDLSDHDHDDSHPIHHHPNCPEVRARLGLLIALAPIPLSTLLPSDCAPTNWGLRSPELTVTDCCVWFICNPSARALPLYLLQLTLRI